jgi:hypothetical protein
MSWADTKEVRLHLMEGHSCRMRGVRSCSAHLGRSNIPVVTVLAYFFVPNSVLADCWRNIAVALFGAETGSFD